MRSINYYNTLITVSADTKAGAGTVPTKAGTVAALQYQLVAERPDALTSDDVLVAVTGLRREVTEDEWEVLKAEIYAKPQACFRTSPLVKTYGWGLYSDAEGRLRLVGVETPEYAAMIADPAITKVPGMRSSR